MAQHERSNSGPDSYDIMSKIEFEFNFTPKGTNYTLVERDDRPNFIMSDFYS